MGTSMIHCKVIVEQVITDLLPAGRVCFSHNAQIPGVHANFSVRVLSPVDGQMTKR